MNPDAVEFRRLTPDLETPLAQFFADFHAADGARWFHPHPFTPEEAHRRAAYEGQDRYYAMLSGDRVIGYGMLRGWDEGFTVPSLGIAVHPGARRSGLGRRFMNFLHQEALAREAESIRLKVYPDNVTAVHLYASLGYRFVAQEHGQLVGVLRLSNPLATHMTAETLLKRLRNAALQTEPSPHRADPAVSSPQAAGAESGRRRTVRHLPQIVDDNAFIHELYWITLRRRPDLSGYKHYRAMLARGVPKTFIVHEMATSGEVRAEGLVLEGVWTPKPVVEILALDGASFVREAYRSVLWREADGPAIERCRLALKGGATKLSVLKEIARSSEAGMLPAVADGLDELRGVDPAGPGTIAGEPDVPAILGGDSRSFVEHALTAALGTRPDSAAVAQGVITLASGVSRQAWLRQLVASHEPRNQKDADPCE